MLIYNYFLERKQCISGDAAIVFSTLFRKSVFNHLNEQGFLAGDSFDSIVDNNCEEDEYYPACVYDVSSMAKVFGLSRQGLYNILSFLEAEGYISIQEGEIFVVYKQCFADSLYIPIVDGVKLHGWELVCYSYLCNRLNMFNKKTSNMQNNIIDTWVSRLQKELCFEEYRTFRRLLLRLQDKGYLVLNKNSIEIIHQRGEIKKSANDSTQLVKLKSVSTLSQGLYVSTLQR